MQQCFVALGSNLGDPLVQVMKAVEALQHLPDTRLLALSSFYRSVAIGPGVQPDYINGVAELDTGLTPHQLLVQLQQIEQQHKRVRTERWGPRTLDLDILLFGDQLLDEADLTIPHPRMQERNFVLYPLLSLVSEWQFPDGRSLSDLIKKCSDEGLSLVDEYSSPTIFASKNKTSTVDADLNTTSGDAL